MTDQSETATSARRAASVERIKAHRKRAEDARGRNARGRRFWIVAHSCSGVVTIVSPLVIAGMSTFSLAAPAVAGLTVGNIIAALGFLSAACGSLAGFGKTNERIQRIDEADAELERIIASLDDMLMQLPVARAPLLLTFEEDLTKIKIDIDKVIRGSRVAPTPITGSTGTPQITGPQ